MNLVAAINKDRNSIMGYAALIIMLMHTLFWYPNRLSYGIFTPYLYYGYSGVEIFLLLSAIGLSSAIDKYTRENFYKRRLIRILPTFVICAIINILVRYLSSASEINWHQFLSPVYWFNNYWYIGFIMVAYLLFPFLYEYAKKKGNRLLYIVLTITLMASFLLYCRGQYNNGSPICCFISRWPIFIMGILIAVGNIKCFDNPRNNLYFAILGLALLSIWYLKGDPIGLRISSVLPLLIITPPISA